MPNERILLFFFFSVRLSPVRFDIRVYSGVHAISKTRLFTFVRPYEKNHLIHTDDNYTGPYKSYLLYKISYI